MLWVRPLKTLAALAVGLLLWAEDADARIEGGTFHGKHDASSLVWRPVAIAANTATLADRPGAEQPAYPGGSLGGLFNRPSLLGGFAAGFLGAGLLGIVFGHGFLGGLGSTASFLGLMFQLVLVAMLARLIWIWWNGRNAPAFSGLSPRQLADPYLRSRNDVHPGMEALVSVAADDLDGELDADTDAARSPAIADQTTPSRRS